MAKYRSNNLQYEKREADRIFYEAMIDLGIGKLKSLIFYFGMRAYTEILLFSRKFLNIILWRKKHE